MRITLHQLHVFACVAELGSVTLAAQRLHMTQPAVSNILKQLEQYYACPLTEVLSRKLSLTAFGKILLQGCHELQNTLNRTQTEIALLQGGLTGNLMVASVSTAKYFIPHLLGQFKRQHPGIHVKLTVCNRGEILQRLQDNVDDFVIMSHPPDRIAVDCADFYADELVVAAAYRHPLRRQTTLPLQRLADQAWIVREAGSGTRYATDKIFNQLQFIPNVEMEISDNEAIKQALIADIGISVLSKHSIKLELSKKLLCLLPVQGFPVQHTWYLVKNKGKQLPPIGENFYHFVHEQLSAPKHT